ncbi:tRNA dihydrouridine synthase [Clostridium grantii]|uniref:tRNA-dihydrouridine synthase n=1 Tax=Clostridium grantii DSM 8605 TaxID=1121316 RepID=A0A1M5WQP0_9CLOT|nr:tRNA-dihydrouridine synthase family protein [Clostridium grantii]SHH89916.1 tRNA-U20a,U20b-dihydrouridine synthase [Clostridium grantii DSM 8605]
MRYYLAPLEGITEYTYRNAFNKFFHGIDKYFAPFIVTNTSKSLKTKELLDLLPENNIGMNIVPQILTNDSEGFISTCRKLQKLGYSEVNLNLGCPSRTVVSKGTGSGFLAKREELNKFLDDIFKIDFMKISLKTRIGMDSPEEFYEIIKIYNKYPLEELIIHPRTRKDYYGNKPNLEVFKDALSLSKNPLCYNGDIFTVNDHCKIVNMFPEVNKVMLGRGILTNPSLINEIKNNISLDKELLRNFHDEIFNNYRGLLDDEIYAVFRMKELWGYMRCMFTNNEKYIKRIRSSQNISDYEEAVSSLFMEQQIIRTKEILHK